MRNTTCSDPIREKPHSCPGRCACYINHKCVAGCTCNGCPHNAKAHVEEILRDNPDAVQLIMDKAKAIYGRNISW